MRDTELYDGIPGLTPPWKVEGVKLDTNSKSVEVKVGYKEGTLWASEAGERLPVYDHVERPWRHLDTCGFETLILCRVPRVQTPEGKMETVPVPWAGQRSRFTLLYALEVLLACRDVSAAAELLGLSWDQLQLIMERAVERGLERRELEELRQVGMDEKSFAKGQSDVSLWTDLDRGRVLEVMEGNDREAADLLFATLPQEALEAIEAVCIDMSGPFAAAAREALPEAALVHGSLPHQRAPQRRRGGGASGGKPAFAEAWRRAAQKPALSGVEGARNGSLGSTRTSSMKSRRCSLPSSKAQT